MANTLFQKEKHNLIRFFTVTIFVLTVGLHAFANQVDENMTEVIYPNFRELWDFNNPAKSREIFQQLLDKFTKPGDRAFRLEVETQIARSYGLEQDFTSAHRLLDDIQSRMTDHDTVVNIRYQLERGRTFNSDGKQEHARVQFLSAYQSAVEGKNDFLAVDAAHMMGIVEEGKASLEWNEKAIKLAEKSNDKHARNWLGSLYNNTGWTYHDMAEYGKALNVFERALEYRKQQENPEEIRIAKWCVARTERSLGQIEKALNHQIDLKTEFEQIGQTDGYVFEEIAECYFALNQRKKAKPYFKLAYDELSKDIWLQKNEKDRLDRLKQLGYGTP